MKAYEGNEPYVFVSYAHKDNSLVLPIIQGLQDRGIRVWYDEGVELGDEWPDSIAEHLESCACVLSFVSRNFGNSHNCCQEFTFSMNLRKDNSIIYLEDPSVLRAGLRMQLSNLHALFYRKENPLEMLLKELSEAKVLKPCQGVAGVSEKTAGSQAKGQTNQDSSIEKKRKAVNSALSGLAAKKYGQGRTAKPEKPAEPSAEELRKQGNAHILRKEYEKGVSLLRKAADTGDMVAQFDLGRFYTSKSPQDFEESVKWFHKAAVQGHKGAQYGLALAYHSGHGVPVNQVEAVEWCRKAAEQGSYIATADLGDWYYYGDGITKNYEEAVKWYSKAAVQGSRRVQMKLAHCYEKGLGVTQSFEEAVKWYRKAAEWGYARAQCELGYYYEIGQGISQSYKEAVKWYRKAADQGYAIAQYNLGLCFEFGRDVRIDKAEARKWYQKAADQGYANAAARLKNLK